MSDILADVKHNFELYILEGENVKVGKQEQET